MLTPAQLVLCLSKVSDPLAFGRLGDSPVLAEFARAIEALVRAECVPPGFVVVPVEPTEAMLDATTGVNMPARCWSQMLAAAPTITAQKDQQ